MRGLGLLFLGISCLEYFLANPTVAKKKCGKFTFPDLTPDMTITRSEHSTMAIPVRFDIFDYPECENDTVYIYLSQEKAETGLPQGNVCIARLTNAACDFNFSQGCSCMDGIDGIVFTKTVTREDSGIWVWMTSAETLRTEVKVNVTYPPRVTELRINTPNTSDVPSSQPSAALNTTLEVTCKWEKGYPDDIDPSKVQLLNGQGVPLALGIGDSGDTWIQAKFPVGCEDAGNITCVVLGAQQNGSAELVVQNCQETSTEGSRADENSTVRLIQSSEANADFLESWMFTPIIVVVLNVFTVIMIVITVTICVWQRRGKRKKRRNPQGPLPPLPHDVISGGKHHASPTYIRYN